MEGQKVLNWQGKKEGGEKEENCGKRIQHYLLLATLQTWKIPEALHITHTHKYKHTDPVFPISNSHVSELWLSPHKNFPDSFNFEKFSFNVIKGSCRVSHRNYFFPWRNNRQETQLVRRMEEKRGRSNISQSLEWTGWRLVLGSTFSNYIHMEPNQSFFFSWPTQGASAIWIFTIIIKKRILP